MGFLSIQYRIVRDKSLKTDCRRTVNKHTHASWMCLFKFHLIWHWFICNV